jgi:hypothetical protein
LSAPRLHIDLVVLRYETDLTLSVSMRQVGTGEIRTLRLSKSFMPGDSASLRFGDFPGGIPLFDSPAVER